MREAMRQGAISEDKIKEHLIEAKGDLFVAASLTGCTAQEFDRYVRASGSLQAFAATIEVVKQDPEFNRMSIQQFENALTQRTITYRVDAIDSLHELATMSIETEIQDSDGDFHVVKSAAMAKVKMEAAKHLHGGTTFNSSGNQVDAVLQELNHLYINNAPMIKEIRQTVITMHNPVQIQD